MTQKKMKIQDFKIADYAMAFEDENYNLYKDMRFQNDKYSFDGQEFDTYQTANEYAAKLGYYNACPYKSIPNNYMDRISYKHQETINRNKEIQETRIRLLADFMAFLQQNFNKTYIRYGLIPENGKSYNYREQTHEAGVSAFTAYKVGKYYIVDVTGGVFTFLGYSESKQAFEITGNEIDVTGGDGEPLLENATIVKKVNDKHIMHPKQAINDFFLKVEGE